MMVFLGSLRSLISFIWLRYQYHQIVNNVLEKETFIGFLFKLFIRISSYWSYSDEDQIFAAVFEIYF